MRARERWRIIRTLVEKMRESPETYQEALLAGELAANLVMEVCRNIREGKKIHLLEEPPWDKAVEKVKDLNEFLRIVRPTYATVSTAGLHAFFLFILAAAVRGQKIPDDIMQVLEDMGK